MSFDINKSIQDMILAAEGVLKGDWPKIKDAIEQVIRDETEALREIALERLNGNITDKEMKRHLEDEQIVFESGLAMVVVVNKATIQKAINAAINTFWEAVKKAL